MATFVIVHGAFGGGWEWTPVADALRRRGHTAFTPTLTGMGDRGHLGPAVGIGTHVDDIVATVEFEDLTEVILVGASYGGMAVTGAADRIAQRVAMVIYVDALVPRDGQAGIDLLPATFASMVLESAQPAGWVPVPEAILPPEGLIPPEVRTRYIARLRPQPLATFTEPLRLTGAVEAVPRGFIRCTYPTFEAALDPIEPFAERARLERWPYLELAAPHDPQLFDPEATAAALDQMARASGLA